MEQKPRKVIPVDSPVVQVQGDRYNEPGRRGTVIESMYGKSRVNWTTNADGTSIHTPNKKYNTWVDNTKLRILP